MCSVHFGCDDKSQQQNSTFHAVNITLDKKPVMYMPLRPLGQTEMHILLLLHFA